MDSAKKRVVLAITLAEQGGAQVFLLQFATWLINQGHDVTVLAGDGTWLEVKCLASGIPFRRLAHMGRAIRPLRDLRAYLELKRVFRELNPDAIHLNSSKMGFVGSMAAHNWKLKAGSCARVVYRIGGWVFLENISPFAKTLYRWIEKISARWKDVIICVHPGDVAEAERIGIHPRGRMIAVPNGIDLPSFDAKLLQRQPHEGFVFGTVAGLYPAKDLVHYMETCAIVHRIAPEARFVIMGDGPERTHIETTRRALNLERVVELRGAVDNASSQLLSFNAFVLPSSKEGMSWALLEAMAAGLPCIATDVGAAAWMLREGAGWIVQPQQPDGLAQAMLAAIQNKNETARRGALARQAVLTRFPLSNTYEGNANALFPTASSS